MGNAFENTFSQVKENESKNVDKATSQQADIENIEAIQDNKSTSKQVVKLSRQYSNKTTKKKILEELHDGDLERKTFYLHPDLAEMFKYAKFKKKMGESQMANLAFEKYFEHQFGKDWRSILK